MRIRPAGPVSKQRHRLRPARLRLPRPGQPQRPQPVPGLPGHPSRLPAGRQDLHIIGGQQHPLAQPRHSRDHMLAAIQHQQHLPASQHPGQRISHRHPRPLPDPQRRRHRRRHPRRVRDRCQLNQPHPVGEPVSHPPRYLTGQPGLTHPARPGHRHQPVIIQQASDFTHRTRPAHETRQSRRKPMHTRRRANRNHPHEITIPAGGGQGPGAPGSGVPRPTPKHAHPGQAPIPPRNRQLSPPWNGASRPDRRPAPAPPPLTRNGNVAASARQMIDLPVAGQPAPNWPICAPCPSQPQRQRGTQSRRSARFGVLADCSIRHCACSSELRAGDRSVRCATIMYDAACRAPVGR